MLTALVVLVALVACRPAAPLFAPDCQARPELFDDLTVSATSVPTVLSAHWTTASSTTSHLGFIARGDEWRTTPNGPPGTSHDALLLGLPASSDVSVWAFAESEGEAWCSEPVDARSGGLPDELPELVLTVEGAPGGATSGYVVAPVITADQSFVVILDAAGRYRWVWPSDGLVWRARMSAESGAIRFNISADSAEDLGEIRQISADGQTVDLVELAGAHRDFVELPDGAVATFVWDVRTLEDDDGTERVVVGDALVEVDPDGEQRQVWSVWDSHSPDLSVAMTTGLYPGDPDAEEWTHANGLAFDEERDTYLVSLDGWNAILGIERESGDQVWALTGGGGDFAAGEVGLIENVHSVEPLGPGEQGDEPGSLLVFNRNDFGEGECAEAVVLDLDRSTGEANERWSYSSEQCHLVSYMGNAVPLAGGDALVVFSTAGQIDRVSADGELRWRINANLGAGFGLSAYTESLYQ